MAMTIEEAILERVRDLPLQQRRQVLEFAESLGAPATGKRPLRSPRGLWAGLEISISKGDIAEIRREMWKNFPREDI